jgi:hypothetical protein
MNLSAGAPFSSSRQARRLRRALSSWRRVLREEPD